MGRSTTSGILWGTLPGPTRSSLSCESVTYQGSGQNYDSTVATGYKHCGCKADSPRGEELSHLSYEWTRAHVSAQTRRTLGELPFRMDLRLMGDTSCGPRSFSSMGPPTLNTLYWTGDRPDSFALKLTKAAGVREGDLIAFGHTHKPWDREVEGIHFLNSAKT